eukprot:GHVR01038650.1.p1 GENE.GHVR01038650.1~~GHVR01038650.1.p1  ORF type:complete len:233 (+),score=55.85 GHVR01038650.1:31-729(+)
MGCLISRILSLASIHRSRKLSILLVGLPGAGKTSLLYRIKVGEFIPMVPSKCYIKEDVQVSIGPQGEIVILSVTEVSVGTKTTDNIRGCIKGAEGVIFVIDSTNPRVIPEARSELLSLLYEEHLVVSKGKVLVLLSKQDSPHAIPISNICDILALPKSESDRLRVCGCSCLTGEGCVSGLEWLCQPKPNTHTHTNTHTQYNRNNSCRSTDHKNSPLFSNLEARSVTGLSHLI